MGAALRGRATCVGPGHRYTPDDTPGRRLWKRVHRGNLPPPPPCEVCMKWSALAGPAGPVVIAVVALSVCLTGRTGGQPAAAEKQPLVLRNVTLYAVPGDAPIPNGTLGVADGKAVYAGPATGQPAEFRAATGRDLGGAVVIPGLVDTHSHVGIWPRPHVTANQDGNE